MASVNTPVAAQRLKTFEGATAQRINPKLQLRRLVMCCLLWEDGFYVDGKEHSQLLAEAIKNVPVEVACAVAVEARTRMKLRHVPLFIMRELARDMKRFSTHHSLFADTLEEVIQRPDELAEYLALYWKEGRQPLSGQSKKGLARAFTKFDAYQLAKYNRDNVVKLRDVMFLVHPKPFNDDQAGVWKDLVDGTLAIPDTWEVELSAGKDKKEVFTRLLSENKLGALALLRNLRNMEQAGVERDLIIKSLNGMELGRVLPFRFVSAARAVPQMEPYLEAAMFRACEGLQKLPGRTALVVDNSGSMYNRKVSEKSDLDRTDAACALAILIREICDDILIVSYSRESEFVPPRRGFALRDAIQGATEHSATLTQDAILKAAAKGYDRLILVTDEQSRQTASNPLVGTKAYGINVSVERNGITYGSWVHIDGWSEAILRFITDYENAENNSAGGKESGTAE